MIREMSTHEVSALHYELLMKDIIAAAEKLPPFPDIVWRVMSLIRKTAPTREIENAIACDQAIAAKIMRLSQSAFFNRRREAPSSLQDAILLIGNKMLMEIVIAACASRYYLRGADRDGVERELWEHSIASALMAEIISRKIKHRKILTIYTAALFHDIGKTVLNTYARIYLNTSLRQLIGNAQGVTAERRALGIDHQELGGIIARNWNFPVDIVAAIEHHHAPQNAGQSADVASIVYMADQLLSLTVPSAATAGAQPFDPSQDRIFQEFGLTGALVENCMADFARGMETTRRMISG